MDCSTHHENALSEEVLPRRPDTEPKHRCMDRREQGSVQPSSSLRDELGHSGGNVRRSLGALHVLQSTTNRQLADLCSSKSK